MHKISKMVTVDTLIFSLYDSAEPKSKSPLLSVSERERQLGEGNLWSSEKTSTWPSETTSSWLHTKMYLHWTPFSSAYKTSWHSYCGYHLSIWKSMRLDMLQKSPSNFEVVESLNHPTNTFVTKKNDSHPQQWGNPTDSVAYGDPKHWGRNFDSQRKRQNAVDSRVQYCCGEVSVTPEVRLLVMAFQLSNSHGSITQDHNPNLFYVCKFTCHDPKRENETVEWSVQMHHTTKKHSLGLEE